MSTSPIVVGLDQTIAAPSVLENALALCAILDRPLVTVTTAELPPDATSAFDLAQETEWRTLIDHDLDEMTSTAPTGTVIGRTVTVAPTWQTLCETAQQWQSPLIVVGSHSHKTADLVLGTTAAKVANRAACSVFVCRPWRQIVPNYHRLLVALDGSTRAPTVLDVAMRLVNHAGTRVTLLRAVIPPVVLPASFLHRPPIDVERLLREDATRYLSELKHDIREEVDSTIQTPIAMPWQAICETADHDDSDVIVMGSHGYSAIDRVLGTTAARVVNHAKRSVLIVKDGRLVTANAKVLPDSNAARR